MCWKVLIRSWKELNAEMVVLNIFISNSDATNAAIATLEPLNQLVIDSDEHPDLLVITGFNMLDSKSEQ